MHTRPLARSTANRSPNRCAICLVSYQPGTSCFVPCYVIPRVHLIYCCIQVLLLYDEVVRFIMTSTKTSTAASSDHENYRLTLPCHTHDVLNLFWYTDWYPYGYSSTYYWSCWPNVSILPFTLVSRSLRYGTWYDLIWSDLVDYTCDVIQY